jgi:hypothetical protein
MLEGLPGGREKMQNARNKAEGPVSRGRPSAPPEVGEFEQLLRDVPDPPRGRPSRQALEDLIRAQPGGPEKIQRARRGRNPNPPNGDGNALNGDSDAAWEPGPNPSSFATAPALQAFHLSTSYTLSGGRFNLYSSSPYIYTRFYGLWTDYYAPSRGHATIISRSDIPEPYTHVYTQFYVPATGWYIVSATVCCSGVFGFRTSAGPNTTVLYTGTTSNWTRHPWMAYLGTGYHYIYGVNSPVGYFYVSRIDVESW